MRGSFKFLLALATAFVTMLAFRALVMTVCTVDGKGLEPVFQAGDHVVVNRWSYGLRTGEKGSLFDYGRICRQEINFSTMAVSVVRKSIRAISSHLKTRWARCSSAVVLHCQGIRSLERLFLAS